ncbi:putative ribonuclease H protein [Cardamine amara subsp. amara]|uniref:Ribonuclease H protein n=1 Tax=Cardamine amara subsp. amara TaxID=228776 RepID=A0ABD1AAM6_CARAN
MLNTRINVPWHTQFAMALWRCGNVFGSEGKCRDHVRFVKDLAKEVVTTHLLCGVSHNGWAREERLIAWIPPSDEWVKLNTDGASHGNPGLATAEEVLRDVEGNWRGGFALNIGIVQHRYMSYGESITGYT